MRTPDRFSRLKEALRILEWGEQVQVGTRPEAGVCTVLFGRGAAVALLWGQERLSASEESIRREGVI